MRITVPVLGLSLLILTINGQTVPISNPVTSPNNSNSYQPFTNTITQNVPIPTTIPATTASGPASTTTTSTNASSLNNFQSCNNHSNTYWTGYRCACRVGYEFQSLTGNC